MIKSCMNVTTTDYHNASVRFGIYSLPEIASLLYEYTLYSSDNMLGSILLHWRTLCIVFGSLLASISFAIGHHLFYQSLSDTPVSTANDFALGPWAGMPSQKFNFAVGNTFASLFRMSLSIAVTTAYLQMVWRVLKAESTGLDVADALSGILANPLGFLNRGAWRKSSLLLAFAGPIW
jgi:hypothetical protein